MSMAQIYKNPLDQANAINPETTRSKWNRYFKHIGDGNPRTIDKYNALIGEIESERAFGETKDVIRDQLLGGLSEISDDELSKVIIAYEPVWAISSAKSAKVATPDEIAEVVDLIRETLKDTYGAKASENVPVLFGGSVKSSNAGAYLTVPGVNGLLIGGASLILNEFVDIIDTAKRVRA